MKNLLLIVLATLSLAFAGCMTSDTINAASTKLQVVDPTGKSFSFAFPKELDAKKFNLSIDPSTGKITLQADTITSSSQGVINSAANAQAQAMSDMAKTISTVVSAAAPILSQVVPAATTAAEVAK